MQVFLTFYRCVCVCARSLPLQTPTSVPSNQVPVLIHAIPPVR